MALISINTSSKRLNLSFFMIVLDAHDQVMTYESEIETSSILYYICWVCQAVTYLRVYHRACTNRKKSPTIIDIVTLFQKWGPVNHIILLKPVRSKDFIKEHALFRNGYAAVFLYGDGWLFRQEAWPNSSPEYAIGCFLNRICLNQFSIRIMFESKFVYKSVWFKICSNQNRFDANQNRFDANQNQFDAKLAYKSQ